jgi:hypothetical protein
MDVIQEGFAMDAAALLLISAVGVAFGWQPMPDGSQQYEYIVQLDPELAQTLADGRSIPIVSDVPPEVQPIGRIRVVVGREEPPRQRLVTRLKPPAGSADQDSAVELAQFSRYGDDRYGAAPPQQSPVTAPAADRLAAVPNPYAAAPSQAQQQLEGQSRWNAAQQEEPPITPTESTPSGQQLFGGSRGEGNAWNADAAIDSAASAASQAVSHLGKELQQNAEPLIQKGAQQIDSQVQAAAEKFGNRTRNLLNELRQPVEQQQQSAPSPQAQPNAATGAAGGRSWNEQPETSAQAATPNPLRGSEQEGSAWNTEQPQLSQNDPPALTTPPATSTQTTETGGASIHWNPSAAAQGATTDRGAPPQQPVQPGQDPWAGVPDPRNQAGNSGASGAASTVPGLATRPLPYGGLGAIGTATGPEFPNSQNTSLPAQNGSQTAAAQPGASGTTAASAAEVRSDMLQQPGDRPLDGTTAAATVAPGPTAASPQPATSPWASPGGHTQRPASTNTAAAPTAAPPAAASTASGGSNAAVVLFAWVMLTGSVAGNPYLFWSYLDVRQKYRSLVRKTARAVGSRFSAA